jgi:hypothetical protein
MHWYNPTAAHIRITSHNVNHSTTSLNTLLNTAGKNNDIILIQEVNIKDPRYTTTYPDVLLLLPPHSDRNTKHTATYMSHHNPHLRVTPRPDICVDPDIQVLEVGTPLIPPIYIINIYNEKYNPSTLFTIPCSLVQLVLPQHCIIRGDLNAHYPLWNSWVRYPTRADELIILIEEHGWHLANTLDTPTYHFRNRTGSSVLDLTLTAPAVARDVCNRAVYEENPTSSDQEVVLFQISMLHPDREHEIPKPYLN